MPTVLRAGPYRFFFYSHEPCEPVHVHVSRDDKVCKFWLQPVSLARNSGFPPRELAIIERIVVKNSDTCIRAWNEFLAQ